MELMVLIWLGAIVLFVIIEAATVGLATIWFAGGALVAEIAALLSAPAWLQITLFFIVSLLLLLITRPLAMKYINKSTTKTNVDSLIGEQAVVTRDIDNLKGEGQVRVRGLEWTARTVSDDERLYANDIVNIQAVEGVKLIVKATTK